MRLLQLIIFLLWISATFSSEPYMHPKILWKDSNGVLVSGDSRNISLKQSCGSCHDLDYIKGHNTHQKYGIGQNCLLCHTANPSVQAYMAGAHTNQFEAGLAIPPESLLENLKITTPRSENCGACHSGVDYNKGMVAGPTQGDGRKFISYLQSGKLWSPEKISESALNIVGKSNLNHSWDIHAERGLQCSDCHNTSNSPGAYREADQSRPEHLVRDPRKLPIREYLHRPDHRLMMSDAEPGLISDCTSCHDQQHKGVWSDRSDVHFKKLSCQACHVAEIHSPVAAKVSEVYPGAEARVDYRNLNSEGMLEAFSPPLLKRRIQKNGDENEFVWTPYNVFTKEFWVHGETAKKINLYDLQKHAAGLEDTLQIKKALEVAGFNNPRIIKQLNAVAINHNVTVGKLALADCAACHSPDSRILNPLRVSSVGAAVPELAEDGRIVWDGQFMQTDSGLVWAPGDQGGDLYLFGAERVPLADLLGLFMILAVLAGVLVHGGLRIYFRIKMGPSSIPAKRKEHYMYGVYERFWHWLQAMMILILLATGLEIHWPDSINLFGFARAVNVHSFTGILLALNAFLALFYHLASGEIKQFIPEPRGFLSRVIAQQVYYIKGIFWVAPHPFEKRMERKLNPMQQVAYLVLLNILLPVQVITGFMMWKYELVAPFMNGMGGLEFLAAIHTLCTWMFAAFILMHIYLVTTGDKILDFMKAMITGWEPEQKHDDPKER
jgi:thiosulfate reductase cytochrome b subunit